MSMSNKYVPVDILNKIAQTLEPTSPEISLSLNSKQAPITRSELYKIFGFPTIPKMLTYKEDRMVILERDYEDGDWGCRLIIDNEEWMSCYSHNFVQLFELYSHYHLARGHCICTGLGFGLREKWLLSKQEVSKLTVLEKNVEVINYHKKVNPELIAQLEVIHCDASEYTGECDTLLLDHYEGVFVKNPSHYFQDIKQCCNNISHNTLWFWPLERAITDGLDEKVHNFSELRYNKYLTFTEIYPTLPKLTEPELNAYCNLFYNITEWLPFRNK